MNCSRVTTYVFSVGLCWLLVWGLPYQLSEVDGEDLVVFLIIHYGREIELMHFQLSCNS